MDRLARLQQWATVLAIFFLGPPVLIVVGAGTILALLAGALLAAVAVLVSTFFSIGALFFEIANKMASKKVQKNP